MPPSKNPTQWFPSQGQGTLVTVGNVFLVDNSGNFLVDNSGNFLITTPNIVQAPTPVAWSETPAS